MPERRRIAALELIQRIRQHEIDGHAARMNAIRGEQGRLHEQVEELDARVAAEGRVIDPETAPYLAGFLRAARARRGFLTDRIAELDRQAAEIEDELLSAFRDAKVNEAVLDRAQDAQRQHLDRKEAAASEEVARNVYLRRRDI